MDELMEMIMPMGAAQMGKGGIKAIMSSNKEDILNRLSKMRKTGEGSKQVAENVDWQTELIKYLKEATSRRFTNPVVKKQREAFGVHDSPTSAKDAADNFTIFSNV